MNGNYRRERNKSNLRLKEFEKELYHPGYEKKDLLLLKKEGADAFCDKEEKQHMELLFSHF